MLDKIKLSSAVTKKSLQREKLSLKKIVLKQSYFSVLLKKIGVSLDFYKASTRFQGAVKL